MFCPVSDRFIVLLIAVMLPGGCGESPQVPRVGPDAVILAFGDSLTRGEGAAEDESYPSVLERMTSRKVVNAGVSGEVSEDGLKRLPGELDQHRPALLILCHGGNDFLRRLDPAATADNIRGMVELAQARGIGVLLIGVPEFGLFLSAAPLYGEIAEQARIPYLDNIIPDVLGDASLKADPVHPNAAGYRRIAEAVHQGLRNAGAL
jgi:lysophospholipase L1-like esterase